MATPFNCYGSKLLYATWSTIDCGDLIQKAWLKMELNAISCMIVKWFGASNAAGDISLIASAFLALPLYLKIDKSKSDRSIIAALDDPGNSEEHLRVVGLYEKANLLFVMMAYRIILMFLIFSAIIFYPSIYYGVPASIYIFLSAFMAALALTSRMPYIYRIANYASKIFIVNQIRFKLAVILRIENTVFWIGIILLGLSAHISRIAVSCPV